MNENKTIAIDFLKLVVSGKAQQAFDLYAEAEFIHHNPYYKGDAESLMEAMEEDARNNPDKSFQVLKSIEEENLVVIHSFLKQNMDDKGIILIHIFRFNDHKIIELWDIGQVIPDVIINQNGIY